MSRTNQRSNPFHTMWNTLWNGLTSTNTNRGTHTPVPTGQTGVPETANPQVRPFRSTHPLTGEAPTGTPPPPGAGDWRTYDHLDVILAGPSHIKRCVDRAPHPMHSMPPDLPGQNISCPGVSEPEHSVAPPRVKRSCPGVLNVAGEHFACDWPLGEDGTHAGWAHSNREAQAMWADSPASVSSAVS